MYAISIGVKKGIHEHTAVNEGKIKNFALGAAMLGAVSGGMQSCSNINPATNPDNIEQTANGNDRYYDYPDYSDRPCAYESYIGRDIEAIYLVIQNRYMIKKLSLNLPTNADEYDIAGYEYYAQWQDCAWAIHYIKSEKRDAYYVDTYYTYGAPLADKAIDGIYYDGASYFEIWYKSNDAVLTKENIEYIRIYRNEEEKRETAWTVHLNDIKNT